MLPEGQRRLNQRGSLRGALKATVTAGLPAAWTRRATAEAECGGPGRSGRRQGFA